MHSYYVHGPDRHHLGPGMPQAVYAMPCPSNTPQGYPMTGPTSPGVMIHPNSLPSLMSPFPSLFDAGRLFAPPHGFNPPPPFAGPHPELMLQGGTGTVTRSFTQTSYSEGGVKTTHSVSTVSRPNAEGGVDLYRTRKTTRQAQDGTSSTDYQVDNKQLRPRDDYGLSQREGRSAAPGGEAHRPPPPRGYHYERGSDHYRRRRNRHRGQGDADYQVEEVEDEPRSSSKHHRRHHRPPFNPDEDVGVEEIAEEPVYPYPYGEQDINQPMVRYEHR